jgi:hypothetical protein
MAFKIGTQTITIKHKTPIKAITLYIIQFTHINLLAQAGIRVLHNIQHKADCSELRVN